MAKIGTGGIIGIVAGAVVVIGGTITGLFLWNKSKKEKDEGETRKKGEPKGEETPGGGTPSVEIDPRYNELIARTDELKVLASDSADLKEAKYIIYRVSMDGLGPSAALIATITPGVKAEIRNLFYLYPSMGNAGSRSLVNVTPGGGTPYVPPTPTPSGSGTHKVKRSYKEYLKETVGLAWRDKWMADKKMLKGKYCKMNWSDAWGLTCLKWKQHIPELMANIPPAEQPYVFPPDLNDPELDYTFSENNYDCYGCHGCSGVEEFNCNACPEVHNCSGKSNFSNGSSEQLDNWGL